MKSPLKDSNHIKSNGQKISYTKEMKALDVTRLMLSGFNLREAQNLVNSRYK